MTPFRLRAGLGPTLALTLTGCGIVTGETEEISGEVEAVEFALHGGYFTFVVRPDDGVCD